MSGEPNFSVNFISRMLGSGQCAKGDVLVYDAVNHGWLVATTANRTATFSGAQAVAITAWGSSIIGQVSYQSSGLVAQEVSGLSVLTPSTTRKLVRTSSTGRLERVDAYTTGDDVVGYAFWDGRVALHVGLPWDQIAALAGGGPPTGAAGGDLGGTYPNPDVRKVRGQAVSSVGSLPSDEVLRITGPGTADWGPVNLGSSNARTGTLPVGNGGTGLTASGTSGFVLTSNGTGWVVAAIATGSAGQLQATNGSGTLTAPGPYAGADYISLIAGTPDVPGVRLANNTTFSGRNADGTADIVACYIDSSDTVRVGSSFDATQAGVLFATPSGNRFTFHFDSTTYAYLSETEFALDSPRHGYTSPYASEGQVSFAVTAGTHTLTATEWTRRIIKFTGTFGGTSTITFPAPANADASYVKGIRNTSTTALTLTIGSGTTAAVAAAADKQVLVTPDGVFVT